MKFYLIPLFFLTSFISIYGQTIEELEYELSWRSVSEKQGDKIDKARLLHYKDPFNYNAINYILSFYHDRKIDSASVFFNDLFEKFPDKIEPYLLRTELLYFEVDYLNDSLFLTKKHEYLNKALKINNINEDIIYKLASLFYRDFIDPYNYSIREIQIIEWEKDSTYIKMDTVKRKNKSVFIHPEDSALFYFHKLENLSPKYKDFLFFPIKQIETFKHISTEKKIDSLMGITENCFFPSWYFVNLPEKWEYKLSTNYLSQIEDSYNHIEHIKSRLEIMKEPCLYQMTIKDSAEIYRLTWLRTFHNAICIRVEKRGNNIQLFYKKTNGSGLSYEDKLIKSKKRSLSITEWNLFIELLNKAEFDNLPKGINVPMCDGALWILEKKTNEKFKVFETNIPKSFFKEACLYLISLSKMKIKEEDIY